MILNSSVSLSGLHMGYDLRIARRKHWSKPGRDIAVEEWLAYVKQDQELSLSPENGPHFVRWNGNSKYPDAWLDWDEGNVYSKNPDEPLVDKMVAIARDLGAQVQGDDGEIYRSGHEPPVYPKPPAFDRLRNWLRALAPTRRIKETTPPYKVGDRVLDVFRKETTVIEIDPKANHGLGKVKIRYDDGREASFMLAASGLTPQTPASKKFDSHTLPPNL